jgi:hypothetical protein
MSPQVRQSVLRKEWNVPQKDIASAVRASIKIKNQRRETAVNDTGLFWIRWNNVKDAMGGCGCAWKKEEEFEQRDIMDQGSDYSQSTSLDKTRHK